MEFKLLIIKISREIQNEDFETIKFLCNEKISKRAMEDISTPLKLFEKLLEQDDISDSDTQFFEFLLNNCHNSKKLINLLKGVKSNSSTDASTVIAHPGLLLRIQVCRHLICVVNISI